jgi:hypothetical protein
VSGRSFFLVLLFHFTIFTSPGVWCASPPSSYILCNEDALIFLTPFPPGIDPLSFASAASVLESSDAVLHSEVLKSLVIYVGTRQFQAMLAVAVILVIHWAAQSNVREVSTS